jgi:hypothetical protein
VRVSSISPVLSCKFDLGNRCDFGSGARNREKGVSTAIQSDQEVY